MADRFFLAEGLYVGLPDRDRRLWRARAHLKRVLSGSLGIVDPQEGVAQRATYVVDPQGVIRFVYVTDLSVDRNPAEVRRLLDALQTGELCACNWKPGEATLKAA